MVASTTVSCSVIGTLPNLIAAQNLQSVLSVIHGNAVDASTTAYAAKGIAEDGSSVAYAAKAIGDDASATAYSALGKAEDASTVAYAAKGTLENYVAPLVGKMDSEIDQIFATLGLTRSS